jgi:hypothetical protein
MRKILILVVLTSAALGLTLGAGTAKAEDISEEVRNFVTCYPFAVDLVGRGDYTEGVAAFKECFASDYQFNLQAGPFHVVCPGDQCPFKNTGMSSPEMRATFAKNGFEARGFKRTAHSLTNITVISASADRAEVKAYLQAWHLQKDDTVWVSANVWQVSLAKQSGRWRIVREDMRNDFAGVLNPAVLPAPDRQ